MPRRGAMEGHGPAFEHFLLYETRARYYLVAYTRDKAAWRVLKISRMEPHDLEARARGQRGRMCARCVSNAGR